MSSSTTRRRPTTEKLTQRKRAPIACQFCRLRKTKCDGIRPVCGFCQHHDAQCLWGPTVEDDGATPTEREILRRLDELKGLLAESKPTLPAIEDTGSALNSRTQERPASPTTAASHNSHLSISSVAASPFYHTRCESILAWPVFRNVVNATDLAVESFVLESEMEPQAADQPASTTLSRNRQHSGQGIQEDLFVPLCRKFLAHVHPRNPILDQTELMRHARKATEHGIGWDGPSCLVVSPNDSLWKIV